MKYFIYCRKSEEDEERQVLSNLSQREEAQRLCKVRPEMEIVAVFEEARSAKTPGRPVFSDMMKRIERGEAEGIVAWHPDRLARNSIDGGRIIYALDQGELKDLKFSSYTFDNSSQGKFMLQIMFGYSKYYVDSLSENVKRGMRTKAELGILPNRPPIGYKNDPATNAIAVDDASFPVIRRIWDFALTGCYSPNQIQRMARDEWGFRTPKGKRSGGKALALSTVYKILSHPFYAGIIVWKDKRYQGKHRPMVTLDEFERVQQLIGRPGRPAPQKHVFAYTGLIRCGACGRAVTAEKKINRYGYDYTYYHCTKRQVPRCQERSIELQALEEQILAYLRSIAISDRLHNWAIGQIEQQHGAHSTEHEAQVATLQKTIADVDRNLTTLTDLRVRELVDDGDFVERRKKLEMERDRLKEALDKRRASADYWFEPAKTLFSFSKLAVFGFTNGDTETRRLILGSIGSNLTLAGGKLSIQATEPFKQLPRKPDILRLCSIIEDVRTLASNDDFNARIERMKKVIELVEGRAAQRKAA